jgi:hypothetical protein
MSKKTEAKLRSHSEAIIQAASVLISAVRMSERSEGGRSSGAEMSIDVDLKGGGTETWKFTIHRTASSTDQ